MSIELVTKFAFKSASRASSEDGSAFALSRARRSPIMRSRSACVNSFVKVRKSDRHPPFLHIYLTTGKPKKRCESKKNT